MSNKKKPIWGNNNKKQRGDQCEMFLSIKMSFVSHFGRQRGEKGWERKIFGFKCSKKSGLKVIKEFEGMQRKRREKSVNQLVAIVCHLY